MSDCCSNLGSENTHPRKLCCPSNGIEYLEVSPRTIAHHIKESWAWIPSSARYFFCDDPVCNVVYFGDDGSVIFKSQLRTQVGVKEKMDNGLLCYCYGVSKVDIFRNPSIKDFVIGQTKAGLCSCKTSNPSGRCCLKDFPKVPN